jgi:hypothetical protein
MAAFSAAPTPPRQRQRAIVRGGDDGDLAGERTYAVDRRREHVHVHVDVRRAGWP